MEQGTCTSEQSEICQKVRIHILTILFRSRIIKNSEHNIVVQLRWNQISLVAIATYTLFSVETCISSLVCYDEYGKAQKP